MFVLSKELVFPPVTKAANDGLLAIGGDLSTERLLLAYHKGIFPWYSDKEPICWWSPDPRFVLLPGELKVSKSMQAVINSGKFRFTINKNFRQVIRNCRTAERKQQDGTWISDDIEQAYTTLHELGYAHSAETWLNGELVGGLYGVKLGKIFFGESMYSRESNASKFAFIQFIRHLTGGSLELIDCQVYTPHLETMGARMIDREAFIKLVYDYS